MVDFVIFTVYKPEENGFYLEEWMDYHRSLGCTHFYLYANIGGGGTWGHQHFGIPNDRTKAGKKFKWPVDKAEAMNETVIAKHNDITYVKWQPTNSKGEIIFGWNTAYLDFLERAGNKGLAALIDIDEFIVGDIKHGRMKQRAFRDIQDFNSVYECKEALTDDIILKDTKVIIDLSAPLPLADNCNQESLKLGMHFDQADIELLDTEYYHYNWSKLRHHKAMAADVKDIPYSRAYVKHAGL
jgi:hypothetical protein